MSWQPLARTKATTCLGVEVDKLRQESFLTLFLSVLALFVAVMACIAAYLVVPEIRRFAGLDYVTPQEVVVTTVIESALPPVVVDIEAGLASMVPLPTLTSAPLLQQYSEVFRDTFDSSYRPEWIVVSGVPSLSNGRLGGNGAMSLELNAQVPNSYRVEFDYWLSSSGMTEVSLVFGRSLRYMLDCCWSRWHEYRDNDWNLVLSGDGGGVSGHMQMLVEGNNYKVSINGQPHIEFTYGESSRSPLGIEFSNSKASIDNFSLLSE